MSKIEKLLKALANERRLKILKMLKNGKQYSVQSISEHIDLSVTSTSKHLNILYKADVVKREQVNLFVFYYLSKKQHAITKAVLTTF